MGLANWLTTLRILLIPVFITLLVYRRPMLALAVFCLASLTDLLDGYIARRQHGQTRLGAFLDPMADKLLLTSAFVTLTYLKVIPFWVTAVVVSRDLMISVGVLVMHVAGVAVHPAPTWLGKTSTALQMVTVLASMAFYQRAPQVSRAFAWATAVFTIASGLQYLLQGVKQLDSSPAVTPDRDSVTADRD